MRKLTKSIADAAVRLAMGPIILVHMAWTRYTGSESLFCTISQTLSLVPGKVGEFARRAFYVHSLPRCAPDCCISFGTIITHPAAEIGSRAYIGARCMLGTVTVGDRVLIGSNVDIPSGRRQHAFDRTDRAIGEQEREFTRVRIGDDTWIGNSAVILANVGRGCVIGAGSVVVKPVPDFSVAVGNPARVIKRRGPEAPTEP